MEPTDTTTLSVLLEQEHHDVDDEIARVAAAYAAGETGAEAAAHASGLLRRHIYLEERQLFPLLREAGLMAPVFVMLREHGEIWATLDSWDEAVEAGDRDEVSRLSEELLAQLSTHNAKEEPILYPQVDAVLGDFATDRAREFLRAGTMPDGWTCERAPA